MNEYFDRELETTPWEQIQSRTFAGAREQVARVYARSPFYRAKYDNAGFDPATLRTPADLVRVPMFEKEDEREAQRSEPPLGGHLCVEPDEVVRIQASSGTTGVPTFFAYTQRDLDTCDTIIGRCFYTLGIRPRHTFGLLGNLSMFVGGIPALTAASSIGAAAVPIGATAGTERTLELIQALKVNAIGMTPSFAVYLGERLPELIGKAPAELGIDVMMIGGEPGGQIPAVREQIQSMWQCQVRDVMGIGEIAGACWAESSDEAGMHFCALDEVHLELVDHETLEPLEWTDGVTGELIYTFFAREATPVVRFRSHDHVLVRMEPGRSGRTAPRVTTLGRTDDMLLVRGINVFPSAVRDVIASFVPRTTGHMRIVLDKPGPLVSPPLRVEAEVQSSVTGEDARGALRDQLVATIKSRLSFTADVELVDDGAIPRTALKTQYIHKAYEA